MSAAAVKTAALEARIAALEALIATIQADGLVPLAQEVQRAHARLDAAGRAFRTLLPKREQPRISPAHWARALADLRDESEESGEGRTFFERSEVLTRHAVLEKMAANREAAAA